MKAAPVVKGPNQKPAPAKSLAAPPIFGGSAADFPPLPAAGGGGPGGKAGGARSKGLAAGGPPPARGLILAPNPSGSSSSGLLPEQRPVTKAEATRKQGSAARSPGSEGPALAKERADRVAARLEKLDAWELEWDRPESGPGSSRHPLNIEKPGGPFLDAYVPGLEPGKAPEDQEDYGRV